MVATTVNNQAMETERRRKHTFERAKAQHLSRQLQMRLQYARLKVEYGWQRQNLNEVENLYFHHSQQRGPRPYPPPQLLTTTMMMNRPSTLSPQTALPLRLGANSPSLPRSTSSLSVGATPDTEEQSREQTQPISASNVGDALIQQSRSTKSIAAVKDRPVTITSTSASSPQAMSGNQGQNSVVATPKRPILATSTPLKSSATWPAQGTSSAQPTAAKSLSSPDKFGLGPPALTYDSFWSIHSATTSGRPYRSSLSTPSNSRTPMTGESTQPSERARTSVERTSIAQP